MGEKIKGRFSSLIAKFKIWISIVAVILFAGVGGIIYYRSTQAKQASETGVMHTAVARQGDLTNSVSGSGTLIPADDASFGFKTNGQVVEVLVSLGEVVEKGQLLARLDDTEAKDQLRVARYSLLNLTSPVSIAEAQDAVAVAEQDLYEAQIAYNTVIYWYDEDLYQNAYAAMILAKLNLDKAKEQFEIWEGYGVDNPDRARAYQALYAAQNAFDTATYYVNICKAKPTDRRVDEKKAELDLANAKLEESQYYLAALLGEVVPEDATGNALMQLRQAQDDVTTAEEIVAATSLYAPIAGTIMSISIDVGDTVTAENVITINDLSTHRLDVYLDESDWDKLVVGYMVEVIFDALPDTTYTGKVISVDPGLYTTGMSTAIHGVVELDPPEEEFKLLVGMSAAVDVISQQVKNAILIPVEALHEISPGEYAVFVMEDGEPVVRTVEVGIIDSYFVEIKSGLAAGDVVTTGIAETE